MAPVRVAFDGADVEEGHPQFTANVTVNAGTFSVLPDSGSVNLRCVW
jgi:hypothetical protein